jgi:hypothetical protein
MINLAALILPLLLPSTSNASVLPRSPQANHSAGQSSPYPVPSRLGEILKLKGVQRQQIQPILESVLPDAEIAKKDILVSKLHHDARRLSVLYGPYRLAGKDVYISITLISSRNIVLTDLKGAKNQSLDGFDRSQRTGYCNVCF